MKYWPPIEPEVVGLDDVGVDQVGDEPGFADEILLEFRDGRVLLANEFDGDHLAKLPAPSCMASCTRPMPPSAIFRTIS
jgi:hypothetical protein